MGGLLCNDMQQIAKEPPKSASHAYHGALLPLCTHLHVIVLVPRLGLFVLRLNANESNRIWGLCGTPVLYLECNSLFLVFP